MKSTHTHNLRIEKVHSSVQFLLQIDNTLQTMEKVTTEKTNTDYLKWPKLSFPFIRGRDKFFEYPNMVNIVRQMVVDVDNR